MSCMHLESYKLMADHKQILSHLLIIIFLTNLVCVARSRSDLRTQTQKAHFPCNLHTETETNSNKKAHFVLLHGFGHGAWCWYKLVPLLKLLGHNVTALDMAASGINPKGALDVPFIEQYLSPLTEFMASLPPQERVILVGHSFGGVAVTDAMSKFPDKVSVAVFATALMPAPLGNYSMLNEEAQKSQGDTMDTIFTYENGQNNATTETLGRMLMKEKLYNLSPIEDWILATTLVRPMYIYSGEDVQRSIDRSPQNYSSVNRVFITILQDNVLKKYFQEWMIEQNPPTEVREINGSDHMVMISNPYALSVQLQDISQKYS